MCSLFGLIDFKERLTAAQRQQIIHVLAKESEIRGTDASGIAYLSHDRIHIYKRPLPGGKLKLRLPNDADVIIGHTRMTTQGSALHNYNNHPFKGRCGATDFALTHNGILYNDKELKAIYHFPKTNIETDSYAAVQFLNRSDELSFSSLRQMAEEVEGMFTFALLDRDGNTWFVKGNNPLAIASFGGFYIYASTPEILKAAMKRLSWLRQNYRLIAPESGQIIRIDSSGEMTSEEFHSWKNSYRWSWLDRFDYASYSSFDRRATKGVSLSSPLDELLSTAGAMGYSPEDISLLLENGYDENDIEQLLYDPQLLGDCTNEIYDEMCLCGAYGL